MTFSLHCVFCFSACSDTDTPQFIMSISQFHPDSTHQVSSAKPFQERMPPNKIFASGGMQWDALGCSGIVDLTDLTYIEFHLPVPPLEFPRHQPAKGGRSESQTCSWKMCFIQKRCVKISFANSFSHSCPVYPLRSAKNVEMAPNVKPRMKGLLKFKVLNRGSQAS